MNRIKQLREERKMNQVELGKVIGVSGQAMGMYENEKRGLDTNIASILADFFGVSIDYLMCKSDIRNPEKQEDPLGLAKIGFNMKDYNPPTEIQKQQIKGLLEVIMKDNKKEGK